MCAQAVWGGGEERGGEGKRVCGNRIGTPDDEGVGCRTDAISFEYTKKMLRKRATIILRGAGAL